MSNNPQIKKYIQSLEALSRSTDDYLYVWDIKSNDIWFFGKIADEFNFYTEGTPTNVMHMMKTTVHPNDQEALTKSLQQTASGVKPSHNMNYRWINRFGKSVWVNCRGNVIKDDDGIPMVLLGRVSRSIFENKVNRITGMFNKRKMLEDSQEQQFMSKDGYILLLGLDKLLKSYSEHGREYMENIVTTCAKYLEEMVTDNCTIYHAEDNVFVACFENATPEDIQNFYTTLMKKIQKQFTITAVALPSNKQYFTDERELYDTATEELIKAKQNRRAKLSFYSKKSVLKQLNERILEEKLEQAINNNFEGFYVCYQPQIRGNDYSIDGVEALMRFRADGVDYSPAQFIPALEQMGLMQSAGLWILKTALAQVKTWRKHLPNLYLNVNFSLSQFSHPASIDSVIELYKESGLPPHVLTLELTETVQVEDLDQIVVATKTWNAVGIDIALDDFGTGYSNLAILKEIACDEIKIERTFISRIKEGTYGYLLVSSIVNFAHQNGICVCCEGVETESDILTLASLNPDLYQGYAFDKPCLPDEFVEKYINHKSRAYKRRQQFSKHLVEKAEEHIVTFDPNEVLSNVGVGLCVKVWDPAAKIYEVHPDKLTAQLLGMPPDLTPLEYNNFWFSRIKEGYEHYVRKNLRRLITDSEFVQFMYPWIHPEKGEILLNFSGMRSELKNGKVIVKGLYRIVSLIEERAYTARPLKYFVQNRYLDIILNKAIAFMEINVSKNKVEGGFRDMIGKQPSHEDVAATLVNENGELKYNEFEQWWSERYLIKSDKPFVEICNTNYLAKLYESGIDKIELICRCVDKNGKVYDCKKKFYITRDEFQGDIMALCVIDDVSDEARRQLELLHQDSTVRSLADDYKSIMYINVDEDTVVFYREDTTLGEWRKGASRHSIMMSIFADRFVDEEDRAEYKYLLSIATMREKLAEADEYRFEYVRKCKEGPRYHEVKVKRDSSNHEALCATIAVKDIEDEVQLRLQLQNALEMAYTDHLTGLFNQQGLLAKAKEMLANNEMKAAVMFMDLDNFKLVNDEYGHGMGDKVLYEVGKAIREETRGKDLVGRYGGDEFVVVLCDIRKQRDAEEVAERISNRVKNVCKQLKLKIGISASIGISFTDQTGYDYHHLKEIADDRLYIAKKRGKNRIVKKF